jgi:capsular exopolysaccharide synthesis family protein
LRNYALHTFDNPKSPVSEAYRTLRTNIQFANVDNTVKCIAFTSAGPAEGKSSTVANIAVAMGQAGKNVLIIDADMRNPTQHKVFELLNGEGLSTTLVSDSAYLEHVVGTRQEGVSVLTAGPIPPNPAELLGSKKMKQLIELAKNTYDMVLVDTPPTIAVTDSSIMAQIVDGVILVLSSGEVSREYAISTKEQLEKVGARILGTVLNKVEMNTKEHYYYYYYGEESHKRARNKKRK